MRGHIDRRWSRNWLHRFKSCNWLDSVNLSRFTARYCYRFSQLLIHPEHLMPHSPSGTNEWTGRRLNDPFRVKADCCPRTVTRRAVPADRRAVPCHPVRTGVGTGGAFLVSRRPLILPTLGSRGIPSTWRSPTARRPGGSPRRHRRPCSPALPPGRRVVALGEVVGVPRSGIPETCPPGEGNFNFLAVNFPAV